MTGPFPRAVEAHQVVRQSLLSTYDVCALATKFDLELRQGWSSHAAATGQILHRAFAKCLAEMVAHNETRVPVGVALTVLEECFRQHDVPMAGHPLEDHVVSIPLRWQAEARIIMRTWAGNSVWNPDQIASVERRLTAILRYPDGKGGHVDRGFTGKPDVLLIDGVIGTVLDYKTGWGIPSEGTQRSAEGLASEGDNISDEGFFWMRSYALLVFHRYPRLQRLVFREVYPRYLSGRAKDRKGRPINPVRQATIDRTDLPQIEQELSALIERFDRSVETGVWRPAPGTHCSFCPRPAACTIFPEARAEGRISSPEEAERVAGRLAVLDALKDQTTKALRSWSRAHGPVRIRNPKQSKVYGPVVRTRTMKPDAAVVAAHVAKGGKPEDLYVPEEYVTFVVHSPEEVHPHAAEAAQEEQVLLEMERAAAERKAGKAKR